ncbi:MAG: metalloenzyme [Armatimonadetes bacterium]|nr:metalloenzyme [Armatimonadota bacterium]
MSADRPHVLFWFVDGVGLGSASVTNPFVTAKTPALDALLGGALVAERLLLRSARCTAVPVDATLGVPGLPQSASGQTSLLTGHNAAALEGRHVTAYPTVKQRALLREQGLFRRLRDRGLQVTFANEFSPDYFTAIEARRLRHAAFTFAALAADIPLRDLDALRRGEAAYQDLTNARARARGHDVPLVTPEAAGEALARLTERHDVTVFEFFLSDMAGHGRWSLDPVAVVEQLDRALGAAVAALDLERSLLLLTSDHGNLEDGESATHTRNPVPLLCVGARRDEVAARVRTLTDFLPALEAIAGGRA